MKSKLQYIKNPLLIKKAGNRYINFPEYDEDDGYINFPSPPSNENLDTSRDFDVSNPFIEDRKLTLENTASIGGDEFSNIHYPSYGPATPPLTDADPTWGDKAWSFAKDNAVPLGLGAGALGLGYLGYKALTDDSEEEKERKRRRRYEDKYAMDESLALCSSVYFDALQHNLRSIKPTKYSAKQKTAAKSLWRYLVDGMSSQGALRGMTAGTVAGGAVGLMNDIKHPGLTAGLGGAVGGITGASLSALDSYSKDLWRDKVVALAQENKVTDSVDKTKNDVDSNPDDYVDYDGHRYYFTDGTVKKLAFNKKVKSPPSLWSRIVESATSPTAITGAGIGLASGVGVLASQGLRDLGRSNSFKDTLLPGLAIAGVALPVSAAIGGGLGFTQDLVSKAYQRSVNQEAKRKIMEAGRYQEIIGSDDPNGEEEIKKLQLAAAGAHLPEENVSNSNNSPNSIYSLFKNL